jgi:hypothetical protein
VVSIVIGGVVETHNNRGIKRGGNLGNLKDLPGDGKIHYPLQQVPRRSKPHATAGADKHVTFHADWSQAVFNVPVSGDIKSRAKPGHDTNLNVTIKSRHSDRAWVKLGNTENHCIPN